MEHVNNIENLTRSDFSLLWGKYNDGSYHPLIFHMIDTASVAYVLTELYTKEITSFELALIALHDIGKATPGFQSKVPQMRKMLEKQEGQEEQGFVFRPELTRMSDHSELGQWYLPFLLEEFCKMDEEVASEWSRIVTSHHGKVLNLFVNEPVDDDQWKRTREEIFKTIFQLYTVDQCPQEAPPTYEAVFLMGLCSVADWIASNENYYPYRSDFIGTIDDYKKESFKLAKSAVNAIGFHQPFYNQKAFEELFPFSPNTLQKAAIEHAAYHRDEPMLMIVEAPMGEGKTEAALGAFAKLSSIKPQRGLYFALPTQATSNMMFSRLENFLKHFTIDGAQLHLLHADAILNEDYQHLKIRSVYGDKDSSVSASEWFVSKKRALLADFGVGTVDQAELAALKVKHFFVRLFALAGKTVIIDEVHAYDAYMSGILEVLLGWLRRLGSSVILLSATLPSRKRRQLLHAFISEAPLEDFEAYPAIHSVSTKGVATQTIDGLRSFEGVIRPLPSDDWMDATIKLLRDKLQEGGCAACIVNTVSDAQKLYKKVLEYFQKEEVELFHARFTKKDRLDIEKRVIEKYGKGGFRPKRGIVVATQVVEQSLDVDFDLMVTQLAPIDLMLQRMGRLHRHNQTRPKNLLNRELFVLVPPKLEADKDIFGKSRYVYYPDILYKSADLLHKNEKWENLTVTFPSGLSYLVEMVYEVSIEDSAIDAWEEEHEGEEYAHYFLSRSATIPKAEDSVEALDDLDENNFDDDPDATHAKTRLVEENLTLVILQNSEEAAIDGFADLKRLYESSVKVSSKRLCKYFEQIPAPMAWEDTPMLRHAKPLVVDETVTYDNYWARYDKELGLIIEKGGDE